MELIGTGGMAAVWKAKDTTLNRWVAVKRLLPHAAQDDAIAERFRREALSSARLSHPGIVTVFDTGEDDEGPFIVLELVEGETLAALLQREGTLDVATSAGMIRQVAEALDYAHDRGVVHRDVKPGNLIVSPDGTVQLTDFGIARAADDPTTITEPGSVVGTLAYLAPEVIEGGEITRSADIYSLGAVAYEMLAGVPPFKADNIGALLAAIRNGATPPMTGVPDPVAGAIARSMSADPASRPKSAGELAASLIANTTLSMPADTALLAPVPPAAAAGGGENPTLVIAATAGDAEPPRRSTNVALVAALIVAGLAVMAFALMSRGPDLQAVAATSTSQAAASTTTSAPTTTTTLPTTTTTVDTPESVADEIEAHLAELTPPDYRPKDLKRVENALESVMEAWANGDDEEIANELESMGEAIVDLPDTEATDHLMDHFIELAGLMGFDVQSDAGEGDD